MDGWNTFSFPFGAFRPIFRCEHVSFREGTIPPFFGASGWTIASHWVENSRSNGFEWPAMFMKLYHDDKLLSFWSGWINWETSPRRAMNRWTTKNGIPFFPEPWKWKMAPLETKAIFQAPFHFHDCGRKGNHILQVGQYIFVNTLSNPPDSLPWKTRPAKRETAMNSDSPYLLWCTHRCYDP